VGKGVVEAYRVMLMRSRLRLDNPMSSAPVTPAGLMTYSICSGASGRFGWSGLGTSKCADTGKRPAPTLPGAPSVGVQVC